MQHDITSLSNFVFHCALHCTLCIMTHWHLPGILRCTFHYRSDVPHNLPESLNYAIEGKGTTWMSFKLQDTLGWVLQHVLYLFCAYTRTCHPSALCGEKFKVAGMHWWWCPLDSIAVSVFAYSVCGLVCPRMEEQISGAISS